MEIWMRLTVIMVSVLEASSHLQIDDRCEAHASIFQGKQLTCTKANSKYFREFNIPLNKTHWLKCENCSLDTLIESTFNIPSRNNVSFLELTYSKLRVLRKFAFRRFPILSYLNLSNNKIDTTDKMCFSGIKKLTHLDLSNNGIKYLPNNLFSEIENLDILNLNKNEILYTQPEAFDGLIYLKYLYLNHNNLQKLTENAFKYLTNLRILYLEHNNISEIHPNAFVNLRSLNFLYINNNSIRYLVQYNFKGLPSLIDLQLRTNKLEEIETSSFNGLKNIKSLYLGDNEISLVRSYGFVGLDNLEILELVKNKFVYINYFDYFGHLVNLKYLWLRKNKINNFTIQYKHELPNSLTVLDLSGNNLTSFNYRLLNNYMPNIKEIFVSNNSWECAFFIYMHNFFQEKNVSICTDDTCDYNVTKTYIDDICGFFQSTDDDLDQNADFSLDCSSIIHINVIGLMVSLLILLDIGL